MVREQTTKKFFDTNIIAYTYDTAEPENMRLHVHTPSGFPAVTSTQVLGELSNVLSGKFKFSGSLAYGCLFDK